MPSWLRDAFLRGGDLRWKGWRWSGGLVTAESGFGASLGALSMAEGGGVMMGVAMFTKAEAVDDDGAAEAKFLVVVRGLSGERTALESPSLVLLPFLKSANLNAGSLLGLWSSRCRCTFCGSCRSSACLSLMLNGFTRPPIEALQTARFPDFPRVVRRVPRVQGPWNRRRCKIQAGEARWTSFTSTELGKSETAPSTKYRPSHAQSRSRVKKMGRRLSD